MVEGLLVKGLKEELEGGALRLRLRLVSEDMREYLSVLSGLLAGRGMCMRGVLGIVGKCEITKSPT